MDDKKLKEGLNVAASEIFIAPAVSIGAVLCAEKLFPHQMANFKKFIASHIIEPHLEAFEKAGGHVFKAYDTQKKKELSNFSDIEPQSPEKPYKELTQSERSYKIADILIKVSLAFVIETGTAFTSQKLLSNLLNTPDLDPRKTVGIDVLTHAIALGASMTLFAPVAETVKDGVAKMLMKTIGMKDTAAKDTARIFTYVNAPGGLALLATLKFGLSKNEHGK